MRRVPLVLALALAVFPSVSVASQLTTLECKFSVKKTADRLATVLEEKGLKVAARIDHAAGAKAVGLEMPPTEVVMFGNPKLGTPLMLASPEIAIKLPMKVVLWQDGGGKVCVGYVAPAELAKRYAVSGQGGTIEKMSGALAGFAKVAAGTE
jgi:uncharacterized protein (DUF302 family)